LGRGYEDFGPAYEKVLQGGGATPTLERQGFEEGKRQFDVSEAHKMEIEQIRQAGDRDIATIQGEAQARVASIYAAADKAAAAAQLQGDLAQAEAIKYQADKEAQATIEAASIDAASRREVTQMQEQNANKRLGAQLGMQWADTSQQMAANPRDFLKLAFRQSGVGVPESLQNFMQPAGGAVPNLAGAPTGIQDILAQFLQGNVPA